MLRLHDLCHSFASIANDPGVPMFKQGAGPWLHSLHQRRLYPYFRHTHKETIARVTEAIQKFIRQARRHKTYKKSGR